MTLLLLSLFACDPASPEACDAAAEVPGTLRIGTGEASFEPIADGDPVQISHGFQGGIHVFGSLQVTGIVQGSRNPNDPNNPIIDFQILADGEPIAGYTNFPRHFVADGDGVLTLLGDELVFDDWDAAIYDGAEVTMAAWMVDACGRELAAERQVTLRD